MNPVIIEDFELKQPNINSTTSKLLWDNEVRANMTVAKAMVIFAAVLSIVWVLNDVGVFEIEIGLFTILIILCVAELIVGYVICEKYKGERTWIKAVLTGIALVVLGEMIFILGYNIRVMILLPILLASSYYDEKFATNVSFATALVYTAAGVIGVATGVSILDLNFVIPFPDTTIFYDGTESLTQIISSMETRSGAMLFYYVTEMVLPTIIAVMLAAMVSVHIAGKGRRMLIRQQQEMEKTARIDSELSLAADIQQSMLSEDFPDTDEIKIFAGMQPAKEVGGDFYDFFMVDDTHLAIVIADVSGKGIPASLFMVRAQSLIGDHTVSGMDPSEVFHKVNNLLCSDNDMGLFVTAFEGVIDLTTGEMTYVNAGHEIPFICRKGEKFEQLAVKPGFVLGGMEDIRFKSEKITLAPGDKVFIYTDGVPEATSADIELYGMERLTAFLADNSELAPKELIEEVKNSLDRFVGTAEQFDDVTMLCLEYKNKLKVEQ